MTRPLAVVGMTYIFTAAAAVYFSWEVNFAVGGLLGVLALTAAFSRHSAKRAVLAVLLASSLACVVVGFFVISRIEPARTLAGQTLTVTGKISRINSATSVEIALRDGTSIAVSSREALDVQPGDELTATLKLERYEQGSYGAYAAQKAKITPLRGFVVGEYAVKSPPASSPQGIINTVRRQMSDSLRSRLSLYQGDVLSAMLLGERHLVPDDIRDSFAIAGISHILAISGYHLAVIAGFFGVILRWFKLPRRAAALLNAGMVLLYMVLVGFSPSVLRAGSMLIISLCGAALSRKSDTLTSLTAAGLFICVVNPLSAADISFQLSFLATLGIVLGVKPLTAFITDKLGATRRPKLAGAVASAVSVTLCATAFTLPVTITSFGEIALYAPLTNLLIAPLMPVVMLCGFAAAVLCAVPYINVLGVPFAFVAGAAVTAVVGVADIISALPFSRLPAGAGFVGIWLAGAAALVLLACIRPSRKKAAVCALLCAVTLFAGALSYQLAMGGAVVIATVATSGSVAQVAVKNRHAVIAGGINSKSDVYAVKAVLKRYSVEAIDLIAVSPSAKRRSNAISDIFETYPIHTAIVDFSELPDERLDGALGRAAQVYSWGDMRAELLGDSAVSIMGDTICLEFGGIKDFILTEKCDIITSTAQLGACSVAVLAGGAPKNIDKLRCDVIIANGAYSGGYAEAATVLTEERPSASVIIKNGGIRLD